MGAEWLWRISQEHHLARRYLLDGLSFIYLWIAKAMPLAIYQYCLCLRSDIGPSIKIITQQMENCFEIELVGSATGANRRILQDGCQKVLDKPCSILKHVRLNCAELDYIDSASLGLLLNFKLQLSERGQTLSFFNMSGRIRTLMGLHGVQQFLLA
jgi:anti-anti-sigma factor